MPRPPRPSELTAKLDTATECLERFRRAAPTIIRDLRDWSAGTTSQGEPRPKNAISDPTATQALTYDRWTHELEVLADTIRRIYTDCRRLEKIRHTVAAEPPPTQPEERGIPQCCNPHGCDNWAEPGRAGRCAACYQHRYRHGLDRRPNKNQ